MKVAAGILLIIIALMNLMGGFGYLAGGALTGGLAHGLQAADEEKTTIHEYDTESTSESVIETESESDEEALGDSLQTVKAVGGGLMILGIWLFVLCGLEIAAAVMLFKGIKETFILVIGLLELVSGVAIGITFSHFGFTIIFGIIAAIFAIIASRSIASANKGPVFNEE